MKFASRKGAGERIILIFVSVLLLYTIYYCLFRDSSVWGFALILAVLAVCEAAVMWFRPEYELTDDALIIYEKKPLKDKQIPYETITEYRLVPRRWFGGDRPDLPKDVYLAYHNGKRKKVVMLNPEDADHFIAEFRSRSGSLFDER